MFTLYRSKWERGGFRAVAGEHLPLDSHDYTRHDFPNAQAAFEGCKNDAERKVVLMIDADAGTKRGTWVRVDKGDGETTTVEREEVFEKCHAAKVCKTGAELRRRMASLEAGRNARLETNFARYEFKPWLSTEKGPNNAPSC